MAEQHKPGENDACGAKCAHYELVHSATHSHKQAELGSADQ